ncbi:MULTISPECIES: protein jag [Arsenicicoccus]|uniref:Jag family protein n=1 Tax=Arsenicicoccus TaxID=267408 RepID=UPI00257A478B|nr:MULTISPECIES: R3H domain-containing nucleic acid-binding protein [Arsenicicoccus]
MNTSTTEGVEPQTDGAPDQTSHADPGTQIEPAAQAEQREQGQGPDQQPDQEQGPDQEQDPDRTEDQGREPGRRSGGRVALLEREGEVAADFLETLLDIADLDGDIDVDVDGDRASVAIVDSDEGRVPRRLVGDQGKVLEALQELTRLAVQAETGERSRLMLDVAGHRASRRDELVELARDAVREVKESGEEKALEPMTAFERKVVHDEVLAAGLSSESEGTEPRRHVVVLPA